MEQEIKDLRVEIFSIKEDVEQILFILTGTEYEKGQGLLDRVANDRIQIITMYEKVEKKVNETYNELDKRVSAIEKTKDKTIWIIVGFAFGSGAGLVELIKLLLKK